MSEAWDVQILSEGTGVIEHFAAPRFRALWVSGLDDIATINGPCWTDEAHGPDDALTLFHFHWYDDTPGQAAFEALMGEACTVIDTSIAAQM